MAAGLGFKTFTTGEVLTAADTNGYLMQGILVFASSAARATAITSPQEGQYSYLKDTNALEYYDGAAWVGAPVGDITAVTAGKGLTGGGSSGDVTVSLATTAKGDLVAGSGASTAAVLTVGNNGETLVADSSTSTGLRYQVGNGLAQGAINGGFDIWQRGTSFGAPNYCADRWYAAGGSTTYSQESTAANLPTGFRYGLKMTMSGTDVPYVRQAIETANAIYFAGKRVVLSYYVASSASSNCYVGLNYSTSTDVAVTGSWTDITAASGYSATQATTSTMSRVYCVFDVPSDAKSLRIYAGSAVNITSTNTMTITGIQLEVGSIPTAFRRAGGTIQGELAACQRYYWRTTNTEANTPFGFGIANGTTQVDFDLPFPTTMRTKPSSIEFSAISASDSVTSTATNNLILFRATNQHAYLYNASLTGLTQYRPYFLIGNSSSSYIGASAEL